MFFHTALLLLLSQAPAETKLATIEGKITHAGTQAPVRKAKVTLTMAGSETQATTAETGDDGKYILKDLKPGRYRLSAEKTGYQQTAYGARKAGQVSGQLIRLEQGAALTGIDIAVAKHGVIAGKVLDFDNEPVAKALVMALSEQYLNGRKTRLPRGTLPALSNDLGEFRIGELPPGKYIVCAVPVGWYQPDAQGEVKPKEEDSVATTCLPNVASMSEATPIEIKDGTEAPGMDIRLLKTKTVTVQGQVSGVPASAGAVTILNLTTKGFGPIGNAMHPRAYIRGSDGKFEFRNVPPGSYILHSLPTGLGSAGFAIKANVEIGDQPVKDLVIPALIPFELKAQVVAEPSPDLKLTSVRMILTGVDDITPVLAMGTANAEGAAVISNAMAGRHRINLVGQPATYHVQEIRLGEEIVPGDQVELVSAALPLIIKLAIAKAEVAGVASNDKGEPVPGTMVALVPNPQRPYRLRATRTDQSGMFRIPNVAPGDYWAIALDSQEPGALEDEEFLKPLLSKAKRVKVDETGSKSVELKVTSVP